MAIKQGCEFCSGERTKYQSSANTTLYIDTFGTARILLTECHHCPPFETCVVKELPARSAFIINFCPHCGRDLNKESIDVCS